MTEVEHSNKVAELESIYLGKYIKDDNEFVKIIEIFVDYRDEYQHMNRVSDEYGNIHFINDIEEVFTNEQIR
jgi:hypothetical protein